MAQRDASRRSGHERPIPRPRDRPNARGRRGCDAREISPCTGVRLGPDARGHETRRRIATRGVPQHQVAIRRPYCCWDLRVDPFGLALDAVSSEEMSARSVSPLLSKRRMEPICGNGLESRGERTLLGENRYLGSNFLPHTLPCNNRLHLPLPASQPGSKWNNGVPNREWVNGCKVK